MSQLQYEKLHPEFGASVRGVDLGRALTPEQVGEINAAIDSYSFVCFPGQSMDDDRQLALTRQLGNPEPSHTSVGKTEYFGTIGNVQKDGTVLGSTNKKTIFLTGNNMWHSDASFKRVPAFLSIMCAYETPAEGGTTMFVSLRAAYDRLSPERKADLDPLVAIHDYVYSRSKVAPDAVSPEVAAALPPVRQRLVRTNPATGTRNLFLGSHLREIEGMSASASRALVDELTEAAIEPEHIYDHGWQPGDVVLWDNRCLLHAGSGYDADRHRRYMRQTRVAGICSTLEERGGPRRSRDRRFAESIAIRKFGNCERNPARLASME